MSNASRRLLSVGALLLLLMVVVVAVAVWRARSATLEEARRNLDRLGLAISEQTARSLQAVDITLTGLQKEIADQGINTPERFREALGKRDIYEKLKRQADTLPQADAFTIIDGAGKLVNFSRQFPIPPTDLSDRDYYAYFRTHDDGSMFISQPVQNRGNGGWTTYLVRRVNGPSGEFLGMVLGAVDLSYFREFYKALTVNAGTTVTLLKSNGTALISFPETAPIGNRLPEASPWHGLVALRQPFVFTTPGVLAPGLRIVSAHPLSDYPLVVNVSEAEAGALSGWRMTAIVAAIGTGCAALCVGFLLRALQAQFGSLERTQIELREQTYRLQRSEKDLAEKSTVLETTLEHMNQGIIMVDGDNRVALYNANATKLLDLPHDFLRSRPHMRELTDFKMANVKQLEASTRDEHVAELELPNGRVLEVQRVSLPAGGMVETLTDITARRLSEARIRYFAHHDDLTKLVNRIVLKERLADAIDLAHRSQRRLAVLFLDLDGFKQVNDTLGHAAGDELLIEVAVRLRRGVRETDTVARLGGDEFAIIQPLMEQPEAAVSLADRLLGMISKAYVIQDTSCSVGVSIGISCFPDDGTTVDVLLGKADKALYAAKAGGRATYRVYEEALDQVKP